MIKSTKTTLKFSNNEKLNDLRCLTSEYRNIVSKFVDIIWDLADLKPLLNKDITSQVDTWLSARMIQCAGKQASSIVRGTKQKQKQRLWQINKFKEEGTAHKASKLQKIYNNIRVSKPNINQIELELDSRFVKIDLNNETSFDGWLMLTSIGDTLKIQLPFKKTKHFNKMLRNGTLKTGVRLSNKSVTFMFDIPDVAKRTSGSTLGIDVGKSTLLSCSNNTFSKANKHGHDMNTILDTMSRKRKGSMAFKRCDAHRTNYTNWAINQLNLSNIKQVNLENIKNLRKYQSTSRMLSHWTYRDIFDKLESYCDEQGVLVHRVNPTYTSQRCFKCGWIRKSNRKGKTFKCNSCGHTDDADLNASKNIALNLRPVGAQERLLQLNKTGFYLTEVG